MKKLILAITVAFLFLGVQTGWAFDEPEFGNDHSASSVDQNVSNPEFKADQDRNVTDLKEYGIHTPIEVPNEQ